MLTSASIYTKLKVFGLFLMLSPVAWSMCLGNPTAIQTLTVAVVPQLPPSVTYAKWAPLLQHVGLSTGQCFELMIPETIPAFEKLLFKGEPDFAFANPYHEVIAKKRQGYIPLLMDGRGRLSGILTVKSDSSIQNIRDLQGKEVAFPAPNAFAASLLIRAELAKKGIEIQPRYVKTHANGYRAVAIGEVVAAGGVNNTLQREEPALKERLRVLYETSSYAPHPFIAHPRVATELRKTVVSSFIALTSNAQGQKMLEDVQMPSPVHANYQRDFAPLEKLNFEKLVVLDEN